MGSFLLFIGHQTSRAGPGPCRDRDAFAAIVKALVDTAEFAEVRLQAPIDASPVGADRNPLAVVVPIEWREQPDSSSGSAIRRVSYLLSLVVRLEDPRERYEALDRLSCVAQNALGGSTLDGSCLAAMSQLRRGRYDNASRHPELRLLIEGEFGYTLPATGTRDVSR